MRKTVKLAGVAHSIAHHAGSGLSCISPHLAEALRAVGASTTDIDLLAFSPYPPEAAELKPLRLALLTLQAKSKSILLKHGFSDTDVASIVLRATPAPWDKDGYSLHTRAVVTSLAGHVYDSGWLQ
jgi:hypothetical protein